MTVNIPAVGSAEFWVMVIGLIVLVVLGWSLIKYPKHKWTVSDLGETPVCGLCGDDLIPCAYNTGDGWWLYWDCIEDAGELDYGILDIPWPFGEEETRNSGELCEAGFELI